MKTALAAAGGYSASAPMVAQAQSTLPFDDAVDLGAPAVGPRFHIEQAQRVMESLDLDALIVGDGLNVYHLTGYWPLTSRMGFPVNTFAVLTKRQPDRPSLIISAFTYYYQLADFHIPSDFPIYLYTAPAENTDENGTLAAAPLTVFADRGSVAMDAIESRRLIQSQEAVDLIEAQASMGLALKKALTDEMLFNGTLAIDSPQIQSLLQDIAPLATLRDADDALARIRPIKSPIEITLMRRASRINAEAALAAAKQVRPGMTYRELRASFFAETARRNNMGTFMVVDRVSSDLYDHEFVDGQAFLIDAVSSYQGYHGDYGRTVFIGEPNVSIQRGVSAIALAWNEVRESLRPGMKFSEIREKGLATMRKLGFNYNVPFNPHSVGLSHTDHLSKDPRQAFTTDVVLQKDMIISVDCPLLEAGIGGSAHLEDLILITDQGGDAINDVGDQTILVSA